MATENLNDNCLLAVLINLTVNKTLKTKPLLSPLGVFTSLVLVSWG